MFKRLPSLRWHPPRDQEIVSMEVQKQSPLFADDFKTLDDELMPYFRELDAEALRVQNQFRLDQVTLIFGAALATILGAVHASLSGPSGLDGDRSIGVGCGVVGGGDAPAGDARAGTLLH